MLRSKLRVCFYCTGSEFEIVVMLKMKRLLVRSFPDTVKWWIQICWYFSASIISSMLTRSPTPLAKMQPQTMTDGCRYSLLQLSPDLLHTHWCWFEPKLLQFWCIFCDSLQVTKYLKIQFYLFFSLKFLWQVINISWFLELGRVFTLDCLTDLCFVACQRISLLWNWSGAKLD